MTPVVLSLLAPTSASAQGLLDAVPEWSAWLGGGSAVLLVVALALAVGMTAKEPRYPKPRSFAQMSLDEPGGAS